MKVLMIGTGSIGNRHMENIRLLLPVVQFLVLESVGNRKKDFDRFDYRYVESISVAIESGVDFAVIASPTSCHFGAIDVLLRSGTPFYIEKPICANRDELRKIEELLACLSNIPATLVGCNMRYLKSINKFRELLEEDVIGHVARASIQVGQWLPDWRESDYRCSYSADPDMGGGVFLDLIHEIDISDWIFGPFRDSVSMVSDSNCLNIKSEECSMSLLKMNEGGVLSIALDYISRVPIRRYEVVGDKGTLVWSLQDRSLIMIGPGGEVTRFCEDIDFDVTNTYIEAMKDMIRAVKNNESTAFTLREGLSSMKLALDLKTGVK